MRVGVRVPIACLVLAASGAGGLGCSARTLVAVDPCPDGDGAACAATTLRAGLIGLWHLDEGPGATVVMDASGNGNNGTLVQLDPSAAWVTGGRLGNALAVEGMGYVLVPLSPSIASIVSAVTVSAWVYFEGPIMDYGTALSRQIQTTYGQYYHLALWQPDGEPSLFITPSLDTGTARPTWSAPTAPNVWTHLAGTYDGKTATLYVDGNQVASLPITGTFVTDTTPLILGGNGNATIVSEYFPGRIDELALYNRALDAGEIQQLASAATF